MEREIIPKEKYVEKALIDRIFSSTVGSHSLSNTRMPRYFKILKKNLMDSITIKEPIEDSKNKNSENVRFKLNSAKNIDSWDNIFNNNKINPNKTFTKKVLTKRSLSSNYNTLFRYNKNNKKILSSFGFRTTNKDFSDVTSKINYLLDRNQILLMKEKKFSDGFNFMNKTKLNENIFNRKILSSRNCIFGKKEEIPLVYDLSVTHKNNYFSKSEKRTHEYLLNELNKLKFYLVRNPYENISILKDFFLKFNIKDISKYSEQALYNFCQLIISTDENDLLKIIKPDSNMKNMIYNLLNIPSYTDKKYYTRLNLYDSRNELNNKLIKSRNNIIKHQKILGLYETNSSLKYIENQNKLYRPDKNYSENLDLMLYDIGNEVKIIKDKLTNITNKSADKNKLFFITQSKIKKLNKNKLNETNLPLSRFNIKRCMPNNKGTFLFFRKNIKKVQSNNSVNGNKKINFCLKSKHNDKETEEHNKTMKNKSKKKKINFDDTIQRLYYQHHIKFLGLGEVKKNKKLTEFIALNFAKKRNVIKNFESLLNPLKKRKSIDFFLMLN